MNRSGTADRLAGGLRERKKAKTRAALREQALRLIRAQGYATTTVEQIAAAAEVSPSTFFRYFPTKEDVVLYDPYDPLIVAAFRAQPPDLPPITALRRAVGAVFDALPREESAGLRELMALFLAVPELRARILDELLRSVDLAAEMVAERVGRPAGDVAVRAFAGAVVGIVMAAWIAAAEDPDDFLTQLDQGLAQMEAGFPL